MTTLTGKFVYEDNTAVANGILVLTLSQPAIISGTAQIVPLVKVIQLDANGNIPGSTQVYGNDALTPSGTVYTAVLYTGLLNPATGLYSTGAQLFNQSWSLTGASVDVSTLTPTTNGASYVSPVTSIGLTMPGEFAVSGSPVTSAGAFVVSKANQSANQVYAGPASGGAAAPGFRALVDGDLPATMAGKTLTNPNSTGTDAGVETLKNKTLNGASNGNLVTLLSAQFATGNITNTGVDQVVYTYTLPASTLRASSGIRITWAGNQASATSTTWKIKFGGTTIGSGAIAASGPVGSFSLLFNNGATNVQTGVNFPMFQSSSFTNAWGPTLSCTVDTTGAVVIQIAANAASGTVTGTFFLVELIQ